MVAASAVTSYFEDVLERGRLEEVGFEEDSAFVATPRAQIAGGRLTQEDADALFARHDRQKRSGQGAQKPDPSISVAISLASVPVRRGAGHAGILLLAATLHRDGRLEPELRTGTSPWIPAERLRAAKLTDREVMVGHKRNFWRYAREELAADISQAGGMAGALQVAETLFARTSGQSLEDFVAERTADGLEVGSELCYVQEHDRISAVGPLLDLYRHLDRDGGPPPLAARLATGWSGPRTPELSVHDGNGLLHAASRACGSMNHENPLTASQRRAVHAHLAGAEGDVTAVSGPPGTGKTTMLQTVVASLLTRHALEGADAPVIVGASTNNQAVQNIITSFASVTTQDPGSLDLRWLPTAEAGEATEEPLRSLAVYCPSRGKLAEERKTFLVEQRDRSETYAEYSGEEYLEAARTRFLRHVQRFFGSTQDPAVVQVWLRDALREVDALRLALLQTMAADGPSQAYLRLCSRAEANDHLREIPGCAALRECTSLLQLDEELDRTLRYAEFWLAVHYYEATWLLAEHLEEKERRKNTRRVVRQVWPQAAALTPCFVMTLYQVPKFFELFLKPGEPSGYDLGRIDLLIVDEAGQVDTPLGLPALALAKRALVVGDEQQLPPVWSLDEETDRELAESHGIDESEWREELRARGTTCSASSSLMRAASHASRWSYGEHQQPGLLLREHFRCHPDIIGFCNALLYDGLLEPKRSATASKIHHEGPAFVRRDVPDSEDTRQGSSRVNRPEARAIAAWILENYAHYLDIYHHQEEKLDKRVAPAELIGVVTPFAAQARLITAEIARAARTARDTDPSANIPSDLARRITVGTAHRLQGAERPIILLSGTYGSASPSAPFIDANPELMNVAVSRAKDLLVVFAAPRRWDDGGVFEVMRRFAHTPADGSSAADGDSAADEAGAAEGSEPSPTDSEPAEPPAPTVPAIPTVPQAVLSTLLAEWRRADFLREEDAELQTKDLNLRLAQAGVLTGDTGQWEPTALAEQLGVVGIRTDGARGSYLSIQYSPQMQERLGRLYLDGKL